MRLKLECDDEQVEGDEKTEMMKISDHQSWLSESSLFISMVSLARSQNGEKFNASTFSSTE